MSKAMNQHTSYILIGLLGIFLSSVFFSCKTAKLSDAEEKQRIGEYYEAAAIYRKVYTKTSPKNATCVDTSLSVWLNVIG